MPAQKIYMERGEICSPSFGEFTFLATELKLCLQKIPALFLFIYYYYFFSFHGNILVITMSLNYPQKRKILRCFKSSHVLAVKRSMSTFVVFYRNITACLRIAVCLRLFCYRVGKNAANMDIVGSF